MKAKAEPAVVAAVDAIAAADAAIDFILTAIPAGLKVAVDHAKAASDKAKAEVDKLKAAIPKEVALLLKPKPNFSSAIRARNCNVIAISCSNMPANIPFITSFQVSDHTMTFAILRATPWSAPIIPLLMVCPIFAKYRSIFFASASNLLKNSDHACTEDSIPTVKPEPKPAVGFVGISSMLGAFGFHSAKGSIEASASKVRSIFF